MSVDLRQRLLQLRTCARNAPDLLRGMFRRVGPDPIFVHLDSIGRFLPFLLEALAVTGRPIVVRPRTLSLDPCRRLARFRGVKLGYRLRQPGVRGSVLCSDKLDLRPSLKISADYYGSRAEDDLVMLPCFPHPDIWFLFGGKLERARKNPRERSCRIGFIGAAAPRAYAEQFHFPIENRGTIVATLARNEKFARYSPADLAAGRATGPCRLVIVDGEFDRGQRLRISDYFAALADCCFFVCPPGVHMPHSHNLVEALALGVVPIFNYASWCPEPFVHGRNCLMFRTLAELEAQLVRASSMGWDEIGAMSGAVRELYAHSFSFERTGRRIREVMQTRGAVTICVNNEQGSAYLHHERLRAAAQRA